jgi:hypothetical protein
MAYQRSVSGMFRTRIEQSFEPAGRAVKEQRADRTELDIHRGILKHSSPEHVARAETLQPTSLPGKLYRRRLLRLCLAELNFRPAKRTTVSAYLLLRYPLSHGCRRSHASTGRH